MKVIKIQGGLGNQMFQYAHGRSLELGGESVVFDTSFFCGNRSKSDTPRNFSLNNFKINEAAKFSDKKRPLRDLIKKVAARLGLSDKDKFFQSEKYFKENEATIREEFRLKNDLSPESKRWKSVIEMAPMSVSIHMRRGDYISDSKTNAYHGVCDIGYYKRSLDFLASKMGGSSDKAGLELFVFSDDIEWTKKNISFNFPAHFVSNPAIPDYEEMYLMSLCKYNIIANSSFSWWGAWLNENTKKLVVAPQKWFATEKASSADVVPSSWIKI